MTPRVLSQLQATRGMLTTTTTAAGVVQVNLDEISFTIYDLASGVVLVGRTGP